MNELPPGMRHLPGFLDGKAQEKLVEDIRKVVVEAPLFTPEMPRTGKKMSVRMSNCGTLGWVTDKDHGYRYQTMHPVTGRPWPAMPPLLYEIWQSVAGHPAPPQACLINFYDASAKMGLHQDRDEETFDAPVVSISLGDACLFRIGGVKRNDPTRSIRLESGNVFVLGNEARLAFHGVDRIYQGSSTLLKHGGRINLTLRRVKADDGFTAS